ncbi:DUF1134 domain-containing protein [Microvirga subterranea]|uniref:DUF1134 domain-containing protein n=1 Tax=Microvirga subterranea TaxID=186651 RepID=A0A370HL73_9HYPH|nr:DUF1134 domain-containing protein [Microvirga subterranea]RDI59346.1 hypothetical protein DES45_104258 [Microvirga subterranea]
MRSRYTFLVAAAAAAFLGAAPAGAQSQRVQPVYATSPGDPNSFNSNDLVESGHQFFGSASRGLALAVQEAVRRWGEPNGYILGQEASGAFFGGVRYGEGKLFTRNAGERRIFWQGPSLGFDVGGEGARTMMLVYNLPATSALYTRFVGIDGSAYLIGGFGVSAAKADEMVVVPIRAGVGARLGVNMGYLKFTPEPTWNPF